MENKEKKKSALKGKSKEQQRDILIDFINSLEEEIKEKNIELGNYQNKLNAIEVSLQEKEREKHYKSLFELSTPEQRELLERIYKSQEEKEKK
ncbi:MAG: hypothetical protein ACLTWE_00170 [Dysgonomonas mossii]|uniref:hypothetical protein n=1 Tax=Dysgonomonas mossii TaxID=163665 RepID=UPI00399698F5